MNKDWKQIKGYEGLYEINKLGQVISLHKRNDGKLISSRVDRSGYYTVRLSKKGKTSTILLHRLLGIAFLPNPDNKEFINHIDGNKLNYNLSNLEWSTMSENITHAYKNNLINAKEIFPGKRVIDTCNKIVYPSIKAACKLTKYSYAHFKRILKDLNKNNTCYKLA